MPQQYRRVLRLQEHEGSLDHRQQLAETEAAEIDESLLVTTDLAVLAAAIVDECAAQPPKVLLEDIWSTREEGVLAPGEDERRLPGLTVQFTAPVTGAAQMLMNIGVAMVGTFGGGRKASELSVRFDLGEDAFNDEKLEEKLRESLEGWKNALVSSAEEAAQEIAAHRESTRAAVEAALRARRRRLDIVRAATTAADIRLSPRGAGTDAAISLPLRPRELSLEQVERAAATGAAEHSLAEDIAHSLIRTIASFGTALERLPATADKLAGEDEETLRDVLLFLLNANWEGHATGETFIGHGKSDILLRWRNKDAFIAECKFWKGQAALSSAVDQLLERYVVWRDTHVALVLFIRDRTDIDGLLEKAHATLLGHKYALPRETTGPATANPTGFAMRSATDARRALTVTLIPVVIPAST